MESIYFKVFDDYVKKLAKGKQEPVTELDGLNKIHNSVVERLNDQGCGIGKSKKKCTRFGSTFRNTSSRSFQRDCGERTLNHKRGELPRTLGYEIRAAGFVIGCCQVIKLGKPE